MLKRDFLGEKEIVELEHLLLNTDVSKYPSLSILKTKLQKSAAKQIAAIMRFTREVRKN